MDAPVLSPAGSAKRVERLLAICVGIGFLALIVAAVMAVHALDRSQVRNRAVVHSYQVEIAIGDARQLIEQGENARRGIFLSGSPLAWRSWHEAAAGTPVAMRRLRHLVGDPGQKAIIARIERALIVLAAQHAATNAVAARGDRDGAMRLFRQQPSAQLIRPLRGLFITMATQERRILDRRSEDERAALAIFYWTLGVVGVLIALLSIVSLATLIRYTRNLDRSRESLRDLNETLEDQVATRTADLSRANEEIQRFAYIVSHDLRSPLVNVMGFTAELATAAAPLDALIDRVEADAPHLMTEDARLAAREDLPEAIGFIRASTQKMDRLINAILKLSREGRRVISPDRVDPASLAETIVASIQHLIDDRGATVTVEHPMPALVTDRLALEQILSNLIENATKYLQPGRAGRIVVSGSKARGRVILSVTDNGRGIAASDHNRVFDLFRRAGQQDQPGEGIGLAHVRALAYRLGGTIDVTSTLGEGSTFLLDLPADLRVQDCS